MVMKTRRAALLSGACTTALAVLATPAIAQVASTDPATTAQAAIVSNQYNNDFGPGSNLTIDAQVQEALIGVTGPQTTGSVSGTQNNTVTTRVIGNEAVLSITSDVNQDIAGSDVSALTASIANAAGDRLRAGATGAADLVIAMTQSNNEVNATGSNTSDVAHVGTGPVSASTINVTANTQQTQGALNLAENSIDSTANSTNLTAGIVATQVNETATLTLTTDATTGIRIEGDTSNATDVKLTVSGNTQSTVGAGNSMTNSLSGDVNSATLAASLPGTGESVASTRSDALGSPTGSTVYSAKTLAPFAISSAQMQGDGGQELGTVTLSATTDGTDAGFELSVAGAVDGTSVESSSLVNSSNTASSSIAGNEVGNTISLTQNELATVDGEPAPGVVAAVASFQGIDGSVTAKTMGDAGLAVETTIGGALSDSTVTTSSNKVQASATGNTGQNRILVDANSIDTGAFPAPAASLAPVLADTDVSTDANAAFAVSSSQVAAGSVTALLVNQEANPTSGAAIQTSVAGAITDSTVQSNLNVLSAAASGNAVSNLADLAGTNVTTTTAVANNQSLLANVTTVIGSPGTEDSTIQVELEPAVPDAPFSLPGTISGGVFTGSTSGLTAAQIAALETKYTGETYDPESNTFSLPVPLDDGPGSISGVVLGTEAVFGPQFVPGSPGSGGVTILAGGDITGSQLAVDGNRTEGSASGNTATNRIAVDATNLDRGSTVPEATVFEGGAWTASADNALLNVQSVDSDLRTSVAGTFGILQDPATAPASNDIGSSELSVSGNRQSAATSGNTATNSVALSATNLNAEATVATSTSSALLSIQSVGEDNLLVAGSIAEAGIVSGGDIGTSQVDVNTNRNASTVTGNSAANTNTLAATNLQATSDLASVQGIEDGASLQSTASIDAAVVANGAIANSRVNVDGNRNEGTVTGNAAGNRIAVSGTNIALATTGPATASLTAGGTTPNNADYALTNLQTIGSAVLGNTVTGDYSIVQNVSPAGTNVGSSELSVSRNVQLATTTGNDAANAVSVTGTTTSNATSGLLSYQTSDAAVGASSIMNVDAPAAILSSTLAMDANVNQAVATINQVENSVSLSSQNVTSASLGTNALLDSTLDQDGVSQGATADNVLNNVQVASTVASATAMTQVVNNDGGTQYPVPFPTDGVQSSTVSISGNSTLAQSTANQASNSMTLDGGSALGATGGVLNQQASTALSTATATSTAGLVVQNADAPAINSSTASINGNATTARANGNVASNALNVSALSLTAPSTGGSAYLNGGISPQSEGASSSYGVLNAQLNAGPVIANVAVNYVGGFGAGVGAPSVNQSMVALNGNSAAAVAVGNSANNSVTMAVLNYGTSSAVIGNEQGNNAPISATVTSARMALGVPGAAGAINASSLSASGNSVSATAVGNSAVNALVRK